MNFLAETWIGEWLAGLGRLTVLARDAVASCLTFKASRRALFYQIVCIGIKSQAVVLVTWRVHRNGADGANLLPVS